MIPLHNEGQEVENVKKMRTLCAAETVALLGTLRRVQFASHAGTWLPIRDYQRRSGSENSCKPGAAQQQSVR